MAATAKHEVETIECNLIKNHLMSTNCDGSTINVTLNDGDFWNLYSIKKSTPDGHCLLYLVVESLRSQKGRWETGTIDDIIRCETLSDVKRPSMLNIIHRFFLLEAFRDNLIDYMIQYLYNKIYNTPYGDLVLLILANAFNVNIVTISDGAQGLESQIIHTNTGDETAGEVLVYKLPDHYDSIIPK